MQVKYFQLASPLLLLLLLGGCTTQAWYEGFKLSAENECRKQAAGAVEECLLRLNKKKYEEYEKDRVPSK